ncbi:MMPL/SSD domain [Fructobacillus evanidus]|uniref:MMPL family transporter n=1 Tax=Fructobacillus evanidus TaxID=3064281 RepID=UPI002D9F55FC|nr:MMPL/SSD domain [Fructobacillus sp. LMG 32999]CAK1237975.1 MMPL/SSD domain [Fructobacillus sp. LMG 32999]CAK1245984.1 MMPL/SSD domain [Fructobacillus sp. LMG 32999]CAK1248253.1 MMPL/SSD domain [Fructobacillus sp. LMG 32999]CAK1248702.1 MMPL/SSD domain [Fructobacillus sp. LMG 32999]
MLKRLGEWIYENKIKTFLVWLVAVAVLIGGAVGLGSHYTTNLTITGIPSTNIQSTLEKEFKMNPNSGTMKAVIQNKKDGVADDQTKAEVASAIDKLQKKYSSDIKSISNPYTTGVMSSDKTTTYVDITFKDDSTNVSQDAIDGVKDTFNDKVKSSDTKVAFTGSVKVTPIEVGGKSELIGIAIAFVLLLVLFRSFVTAGMPIISALVGLVSGVLLITIGTNFITLASVSQTLAVMLSLAVGIDYTLFILNRYRTDLADTNGDKKTALGLALSEAGSSVIFAGVTVIIAVCGLAFAGIEFVTTMGLATAVAVAVAVVSALTFLPALIAACAKFIKPNNKTVEHMAKNPSKITKLITGHPWTVSIVAILVLVGIALPAQNMRLGMPYNGSLPDNRTERQAYDMISDKFGEGVNSPLIAVVKMDTDKGQAENEANLAKIAGHIADMKGVKMMSPLTVDQQKAATLQTQLTQEAQQKMMAQAQATGQTPTQAQKDQAAAQIKQAIIAQASKPYQISADGKYAMMVVIPTKGSAAKQTTDLVNKIKDYSDTTKSKYDAKITMTGVNAVNLDITKKLNDATPLFAVTIIVLAFILLMVVFRSFVIPAVAMVGFGLSLLASFGFTTLVIQEGFMKGLFGVAKGAPIISFLPIIATALIFGLAMDYEVFMVSRAREEYAKTGDNNRAVTVAMQSSGPIVVTAALIMIAVFGSFALDPDPTIKSVGLALSFGIFFDAFIVRLLFVPAMMKIFGKWNWVFPGNKHK